MKGVTFATTSVVPIDRLSSCNVRIVLNSKVCTGAALFSSQGESFLGCEVFDEADTFVNPVW
jgi:chorismate-pyruvate lyase